MLAGCADKRVRTAPIPATFSRVSDIGAVRQPEVGWAIHRQAELRAQEYGWDWTLLVEYEHW